MGTTVLSLEHISIGFSGVQVLHDASFSLNKQEIHAIVGKNGAGKSTFMKVLTGVYTPDKGTIVINGRHVIRAEHRSMIAMVYQDLSLVPTLSVMQNIFLVHNPHRKYGILQDKAARTHALRLLAQVGVTDIDPDVAVATLSAGKAQLVEIAKAIASEPEIIVFDEPTASLTEVEIKSLFKTITRLREQGLSIIYITHYLEDVLTLCNRVTVLWSGRVVSTRTIRESTIATIVTDMLGENAEDSTAIRTTCEKTAQDIPPVLELIDATSTIVGPISLKVYPCEIIGLAGLLGSGRTEILRMIFGLDVLKSGNIYISGNKIKISNPQVASTHGITLVPEERRTQGLILDFDIKENISLLNLKSILTHGIIDTKKHEQRAEHMIQKLQIVTTGHRQVVRYLSGGNQQKVVLAKCLDCDPKILLLDDPTFGVDIHAKTEIMKIISTFAEAGNAVLFVSSEFSEITHFCDRTYIVKKKKIATELNNSSIQEKDILTQVQ